MADRSERRLAAVLYALLAALVMASFTIIFYVDAKVVGTPQHAGALRPR